MALDADPTIQYALASRSPGVKNWWPNLTQQAKDILPSDPYNTYTHTGLPPGPIANPGRASILASIYPLKTDDFYFLHIPHSHGHDVFSKTLAEQCANQVKYGYAPCQ
jgi:UPF0755 protein